ncbi:MAG: hypothetical protein MZW92_80285 [Comamonadaceae bacterium]|nr:hypothetical protein [Comamonadaceae bacterium]
MRGAAADGAPPRARCCATGSSPTSPPRNLVPGDIVLLEAGNVVPADLRLTEVGPAQGRRRRR